MLGDGKNRTIRSSMSNEQSCQIKGEMVPHGSTECHPILYDILLKLDLRERRYDGTF